MKQKLIYFLNNYLGDRLSRWFQACNGTQICYRFVSNLILKLEIAFFDMSLSPNVDV
jgi:hypothetical protein